MKPPPSPIALPRRELTKDMMQMKNSDFVLCTRMSEGTSAPYFSFRIISRLTYRTLYHEQSKRSTIKLAKIDQLVAPHVSIPAIEGLFGEPLIRLTTIDRTVSMKV